MEAKNFCFFTAMAASVSCTVEASLPTVPVIYGAPYSITSAYNHSVSNEPTVSSAIAHWWIKYKAYWGKTDAECFYTVTSYSNSSPGGMLASVSLGGQCGGGDGVFGTAKCPTGYALSANTCVLQNTEQLDKEKGASCNNAGHPINSANGNKNKIEDDFKSPGAFPILVSRTYNSNDDSSINSGFFGNGWTWNHGGKLATATLQGKEFIIVDVEGGNKLRAVYDNGQWRTDEDVHVGIVKSASDYQISYANGRKETYSFAGKLLVAELAPDYKLTYTYNSSGLLSGICNPTGYCLSLNYNLQGMISNIKRESTIISSYEYDAQNRLVKVTDQSARSRDYLYEDARFPFALTGINNESGSRYSTYSYDAQGRGVSTELGEGQDKYSFSYNVDGTTTVTNPLGKNTTYTYQIIHGIKKVVAVQGHPSTNCASSNKAYTYDVSGNLTSATDWKGNITTYTYNDRGLETTRTQASGTPQARTTTTTWHATFNLPLTVTEGGQVTTYTYDSQGRQTSRTQTAL